MPTFSPTARPTEEDTSLSIIEIITVAGFCIGIVGLGCWTTFWYISRRKSQEVKEDINIIQEEGRELKETVQGANLTTQTQIEEMSYDNTASQQETMSKIRAFNMPRTVQ